MIRVGLYGINGHQIQDTVADCEDARLVATAALPADRLPPTLQNDPGIRHYESLPELLANPEVDFVSICSPRRADQAADAILALEAGKHVLAEKPCALTEQELDAIIETAARTGKIFHEMSGTAFGQPYLAMREVVRSGRLGEVVQVVTEKSYPYFDGRPQDETLDGGLTTQNGIHALRFVEHVAGTPIASIQAVETTLGNPVSGGGLRMASSMMLTLCNGGVAVAAANYLNPRGTGVWGDESLRILGTLGMVESRGGGAFTRLVIGEEDLGALDCTPPAMSWHQMLFASILGRQEMPLTLEEELSPTRWVIRANAAAKSFSNAAHPER